MHAAAGAKASPTSDENGLIDISRDRPPTGLDLLVKLRLDAPKGEARVQGYDASGLVVAAEERAMRLSFAQAAATPLIALAA